MVDFPLNVSRETEDRLRAYKGLIEKWTPKINLIARSTISDIWERHILDSAQVWPLLPSEKGHLVDIGSGGGMPAVVLAAMAKEHAPEMRVTLVESDARKCVFLRTVGRELDLDMTVLNTRIETADPQNADILTARALAALPALIPLCQRHMKPGAIALLAKGEAWKLEIEKAQENWHFQHEAHPSTTHPKAVILELREIRHV